MSFICVHFLIHILILAEFLRSFVYQQYAIKLFEQELFCV